MVIESPCREVSMSSSKRARFSNGYNPESYEIFKNFMRFGTTLNHHGLFDWAACVLQYLVDKKHRDV